MLYEDYLYFKYHFEDCKNLEELIERHKFFIELFESMKKDGLELEEPGVDGGHAFIYTKNEELAKKYEFREMEEYCEECESCECMCDELCSECKNEFDDCTCDDDEDCLDKICQCNYDENYHAVKEDSELINESDNKNV